MRLSHVVVGDPVAEVARATQERCSRFANNTSSATTGSDFWKKVKKHRPAVVILSLELLHPSATEVATKIRKKFPKTIVIGTFRELAVPTVEKLRPLGVDFFIPHPAPLPQMLQILSKRFGISTRLQPRFDVQFNVYRADGVLVGETRNISSRGVLVHTLKPARVGQSLLLDLDLPDSIPTPLRVRCWIVETETHPSRGTLARVTFEKILTTNRRRVPNFLHSLEEQK